MSYFIKSQLDFQRTQNQTIHEKPKILLGSSPKFLILSKYSYLLYIGYLMENALKTNKESYIIQIV